MRIVIVGAGLTGLSAYLFLVKHLSRDGDDDHHINIYESYDIISNQSSSKEAYGEPTFVSKAAGGALGISKNGLAVLSRMDSGGKLWRKIQSRGHPISRWKMASARGWTIADAPITQPQNSKSTATSSMADMVMIARSNIWEALRDEVLQHKPDAVIKGKLIKIQSLKTGKVQLEFESGSVDTADLVIGADGLRSFVRRTMFEHAEDLESQTWWDGIVGNPPKVKDYVTPHFEGLIGLAGFVPIEVLAKSGFEEGSMAVTFGPNGFFGYGYLGEPPDIDRGRDLTDSTTNVAGAAGWWSTFSSSDPFIFRTKEMKGTLGTSEDSKTMFDKDAALSNLLARHESWQNPTIRDILQYVAENRALLEHDYPTYTTPELPTWEMNGNVVLIGDAAHALQPSSGQGASQGLEDAESLALFLKYYLQSAKIASITEPEPQPSRERRAIAKALNHFVRFRKPRLAKIFSQSQKMSRRKMDMNVVQEFIMYFFIWLASKLKLMQNYNEELFEYDIPAEVAIAVSTD